MGVYVKHVWVAGVDEFEKARMDNLEDGVGVWVRKAADQTVNNSTVLVNDTELKIAMLANEVWEAEIFTIIDSSSGDADYKGSVVGPALSAIYGYKLSNIPGGTWTLGAFVNSVAVGQGVGVPALGLHIHVLAINGANAGDLQFQWAQNTAKVADTKTLANSFMRGHRLA